MTPGPIVKIFVKAALFGLAVFLITTVTVWRSTGVEYYNNYAVQVKTLTDIRSLTVAIEEYRMAHGTVPPKLEIVANQIKTASNFYRGEVEAKPGDLLYDGYGNRYIYAATGTSYSLTSLGRDGKPGGKGYDNDIKVGDFGIGTPSFNHGPEEMPGYMQYWTLPQSNRPVYICAASGILAFFLAAYSLWRNAEVPHAYAGWQTFVAIIIGAIIETWLLAMVHVPSTH